MNITVLTAPTEYPVQIDELKDQAVIEHTEDDKLLLRFIASVVSDLDPPYGFLGRAMITQTLQYWLKEFPGTSGLLKLPFPPLQSVTSVKYYDSSEVLQTVAAADYTVVAHVEPGRVELDDGESWPTDLSDREYPIVVEYVAGYGDGPDDVPEGLRHWIMIEIATMVAQREHIAPSNLVRTPYTQNAIERYRFRFVS